MRHGGDHLKDAPANDGVGVEHDGAGSLSQCDPVTAAQQVAEIGSDQKAVGDPACGFVKMKSPHGAANPRSQRAGLAGIGKELVNGDVVGERKRGPGEHESAWGQQQSAV